MKLRFLGLTIALALTTAAASAQNVGLYFNPLISRISTSKQDTGPFAFLGPNASSQIFGGVDLGVTYNFLHYAKVDAGVDVRDTIQHGNSASLNSYLFGANFVYKPTNHPKLKPYFLPSLGLGRSKSPYNPVHKTNFQYTLSVGADYKLSKHVDWRVIEIGYGSVTTVSSTQFGSNTGIPPVKIVNFSTGLVFRVP